MADNSQRAPFKAYIVEAVRSAGGKRGGRLSGWHPADLGAAVCDGLLARAGVPGEAVEDVAFGCVTQSGAQAENLGRNVVLSSERLPNSVPAFTIDRQCGSAQQALHLAAQAVMSGTQDVVIAGGVESMSVVPMDSNVNTSWEGGPHTGAGIAAAYGELLKSEFAYYGANPVKFDQFVGAELVAKKYSISREDADAFALRSHTLAAEAAKAGRFTEIVPVPCRSRPGISKAEAPKEMHTTDEGIRPKTNLEQLAKLKPILQNGVLTAAAASQICDGASAMLVCNERGLEKLGVKPRGRVVELGLSGIDPVVMLEGPVPATKAVLARAGLTMDQIDLVEVNEAFSSVPLMVAKAILGGDLTKLNVNGGAIARGHPMGATGGMLISNMLGELERRGGRYGLLTMCESGGTANATIIERLDHRARFPMMISAPSSHMTISRAIQTVAAWKGDATAITYISKGNGPVHLTFRDLDLQSNRLARAYKHFHVDRNHFIVLALPTGPEVCVAAFACWKLGATPVNVGAGVTFRERDAIVRLANPKLVVGVPTKKEPTMPLHDGYMCLPEGFVPGPLLSGEPLPEVYSNSWLVACSGGSTGRPKLIVLNEPSFVAMKDIGGGRLAMENGFSTDGGGIANGVELIPSPLSHNAPFYCAIQGLLSGSQQVLLKKFDPELMLGVIQDYKCTFSYMVPTLMKRVWDLPESVRKSYDVSSLRGVFHMAAPCPPWLKEAWCNWLGPQKIYELYGATEAQAYTLIRGDQWLARPEVPGLNLVGRPACGELQIRDTKTKQVLPPGTIGEVWMRHHERRVTYYYRGAETKADPAGWETMGDMGMLDDEGYLHLGDRKTDMVLIGGVNVYPAEVEAVLESHPAVKNAVVCGVPDGDLGHVLNAVVYTGGEAVTSEDLIAFAKDKLASVKVPRVFHFSDEYIREEDGKCRRSAIAAKLGLPQGEKADKTTASAKPVVPATPLSFAGRVAIVTGAGNGLGKEYAKILGSRGAKVVVNDLGSSLKGDGASGSLADATVETIKQAGGEAIANYDSVVDGDKIVKAALDAYGRVDIVINNAGILRDVSFRKMSYDDWDKVYQVHLRGAFAMTHAAWPHMEKNKYGRILNITSSTGLYGSFGQSNYAAMKSALLGFTYTLALEGKKRNINANVIAPLAASRMMETVRSKEELQKLPMESMANLAAYLCHESCTSTGGVFELGGHWIARLGWRRSRGARFDAGFSVEDVAARFAEISDFADAEFPEDANSGEERSMAPPLAKAKL
jgi:acetyl-CoA acetyltransferase family protein